MISLTTFFLQILGAALIAVFIVWSMYKDYKVLQPNNRWFKSLALLPDSINTGIRVAIVFEAMFLFADLVWVAEPTIHKFYFYVLNEAGLRATQVGIAVLVILFGLVAYLFKLSNQRMYGFLEVFFAGALGVGIAQQMTAVSQLTGHVTALLGAVYVVSRGMGNIVDGWKKVTSVKPGNL